MITYGKTQSKNQEKKEKRKKRRDKRRCVLYPRVYGRRQTQISNTNATADHLSFMRWCVCDDYSRDTVRIKRPLRLTQCCCCCCCCCRVYNSSLLPRGLASGAGSWCRDDDRLSLSLSLSLLDIVCAYLRKVENHRPNNNNKQKCRLEIPFSISCF